MKRREDQSSAEEPKIYDSTEPILLTRKKVRKNGVAPLTLVLKEVAQASDSSLPEIEGELIEEGPESMILKGQPVEDDADKIAVTEEPPSPPLLHRKANGLPVIDIEVAEEPVPEESEPVDMDFDEKPAPEVSEPIEIDFDLDISVDPPQVQIVASPMNKGLDNRPEAHPIKGRLKTMHYGSEELKKMAESPVQVLPEPKPKVPMAPLVEKQLPSKPIPAPRAMTEQMFQPKKAGAEGKISEEQRWFQDNPKPAPVQTGENISNALLRVKPSPSGINPKATPTESQKMNPEMLKKEIAELEKMVWEFSGVILKNKNREKQVKEIRGGHLLALVLISHKNKKNVCDASDPDNKTDQGGNRGNDENGEKWSADEKQYPDGIYLFLKSPGFGLSVLAGEIGNVANEERLTTMFNNTNNA